MGSTVVKSQQPTVEPTVVVWLMASSSKDPSSVENQDKNDDRRPVFQYTMRTVPVYRQNCNKLLHRRKRPSSRTVEMRFSES